MQFIKKVSVLFFFFACSVAYAEKNNLINLTGNGITDNSSNIQKAVDEKVGDIVFPRGVYKLTKTVTIDLDQVGPTSIVGLGTAKIEMHGPGPAFRFIGTHLKGTAAPNTISGNVWKNQRMPVVRGIEIVGKHKEACGIEAFGTMQLSITDVDIRHTLHAIHLVERNRNVIISDCHLYENKGVGLYLDDLSLHQINVTGSHISYNQGGGIVVRAGDVRNLHITGCDLEGNMGPPEMPATANVLVDCREGSIGEVAVTGCTIQHTYKGTDSANIRFIGPSNKRTFTEELRDGNVTITGNILSDTQCNVDIHKMRGVTITGNTIWKGYQHNLKLTGCSTVNVTGNMFERNPRYGYGVGNEFANAILIKDCHDSIFANNLLTGIRSPQGAIELIDCRRVSVTGCSILDCDVAGIRCANLTKSRIQGNVIDHEKAPKDWVSIILDDNSQLAESKNSIQEN